jgi:hypothetical protein
MDHNLLAFVRQFAGVVAAAFALVVLVSFLSMPYTLAGHPGEAQAPATGARHMT